MASKKLKPIEVESMSYANTNQKNWRVQGEPGALVLVSYGSKFRLLKLSSSRGSSKFLTKNVDRVKLAYLKNLDFKTFR